jgi:tetratricopeptide (TPR) repeat protein
MRSRAARLLAIAALALLARPASAEPPALPLAPPSTSPYGFWQRARDPEIDRRAALVAEATSLELKFYRLTAGRPDQDLGREEVATLGDMYLARAADLLEQAGARTANDALLRMQLAEIYSLRQQHANALPLFESLARPDVAPAIRSRALAELAVTYAHLGRVDDEIKAYTAALAIQPVAHERSRLLANRAEAYMLQGDVIAAVDGYRAALALLTNDYLMFGSGPTTLWGLAVALDRSGDLDGGLDAVRLARSYDPQDRRINGPGWFYLPDYDRHWYEALGHWQVARKAGLVNSVRADAYARAMASWAKYLDEAARDDKWIAVARVRLLKCATERDEYLRRPVSHTHDPDWKEMLSGKGAEQGTGFTKLFRSLRGKKDDERLRAILDWERKHWGE